MAVLVLNKDNNVTSLELVEQINFFRKQEGTRAVLQHNDLLKVIRDEFEEEISLGKISLSEYKSNRGKMYPMFELTISQAKQVLVRESKVVRKAVIKRLEELEKSISQIQHQFKIPQTYKEALMLAVEQQEIIEQQEEKIEILTHTENTYTATELANEIGMKSAQKFNVWLQDCGFQRRVNGTWVPYAKFSEEGYVEIKQEIVKTKEVYHRKFTQKGREYILDLAKDCSGKGKVC